MDLKLNTIYFANEGHEKDTGEYPDEDRALFDLIRKAWPELTEWGDLPIGVAWGSYSQEVYLLSWLDESQITLDRVWLLEFIAYIQWHEVNGEPKRGLSPEELRMFAIEQNITV